MDFSPFRKESNGILEQFHKPMVCCLWVSKIHESKDTRCCSLVAELYTELLKVILLPGSMLYVQDAEALIYSTVIFSIVFSLKFFLNANRNLFLR